MGFLDNVIKAVNKVKEIADDIQEFTDKTNNDNQKNIASAPTGNNSAAVGSYVISKPEGVCARECKGLFFDTDQDGRQVKINTAFEIDKRFHQYSSGACEIDSSFVYSPGITDDDEWAEWDIGVPYIMVGFEQFHNNILTAYQNGKPLPVDSTIAVVSGSPLISYKTSFKKGNNHYVAYHFKRGFDSKLLYHFAAYYPTSYIGKPIEKIILDALELMAMTYTETVTEEAD